MKNLLVASEVMVVFGVKYRSRIVIEVRFGSHVFGFFGDRGEKGNQFQKSEARPYSSKTDRQNNQQRGERRFSSPILGGLNAFSNLLKGTNHHGVQCTPMHRNARKCAGGAP